jgi:hypothetical protein
MLVLLGAAMAGCQAMGLANPFRPVIQAEQSAYPDAGPPIPVDVDGDEVPDALAADRDDDGQPDRDDDGDVVIISGSEHAFALAREADTTAADIAALVGAFGIPGAGLLAVWLRKRKLAQRLTGAYAEAACTASDFQTIVASVEHARKNLPASVRQQMDQNLDEVQQASPTAKTRVDRVRRTLSTRGGDHG